MFPVRHRKQTHFRTVFNDSGHLAHSLYRTVLSMPHACLFTWTVTMPATINRSIGDTRTSFWTSQTKTVLAGQRYNKTFWIPQSRDWSPKAKCIKPVRRPALPGFTSLPSCSRACGMKLPSLILHILSIPVKHFGCGYAALCLSWLNCILFPRVLRFSKIKESLLFRDAG